MKAIVVNLIFFLLLVGCAGIQADGGPETRFAVTGVTVINPRTAAVSANQIVLVENGRIRSVTNAGNGVPRSVRIIDGRGKYLIPGLWDSHTHLSKTGRQSLSLFLANGVTGVRDMGSNLEEMQSWSRAIASGGLAGPTIMFSGPMLEAQSNIDRMRREGGVEAFERQRVGVANPEEGRAAVRRLAEAGVHQIKMRTTPGIGTSIAVSKEAEARGLPFAAHPFGSLEDMIPSGIDSIEHFAERSISSRTPQETRGLYRKMAAAGMHVSNTAVNYRSLLTSYDRGRSILANDPASGDPRRKYVCGYILQDWAEQLEESRGGQYRDLGPLFDNLFRQLKIMHEEGVPMLAGSDAGVMFVYPGFSMHDELDLMVNELGFAAMDVLRIATNGLPVYFRLDQQRGAIAPGMLADFVLLDANPLEDIRNTRRIRGVAAAGRWYDRGSLDRLLTDVEQDARGDCRSGSNAGVRK